MTSKANGIPYHSALATGVQEEADPVTALTEVDGGYAVAWDVSREPMPDIFHKCDLFYAEPSWPAGLKNFDERAGVKGTDFAAYMQGINDVINLGKPTVLFCGKLAQRHLPPADYSIEADLNGNLTPVCFWNGAMADGASNQDIIRDLATRFDMVGDFSCGYGTTARLFKEAGKSFVMSDYNPICVGYVVQHAGEWG